MTDGTQNRQKTGKDLRDLRDPLMAEDHTDQWIEKDGLTDPKSTTGDLVQVM